MIYLLIAFLIATGLFDIIYSRKAWRTTRRRDDLIAKLLPKGLYILIGLATILFVLKFFGVDTKSILASMGIGGIALSFAFAPLIKSILSGIKILITAPFNLGQYVKVAGHEGIVERIGFTTINIRTGTGSLVTLNTQTVDGTIIENCSDSQMRPLSIDILINPSHEGHEITRFIKKYTGETHIQFVNFKIRTIRFDESGWKLRFSAFYDTAKSEVSWTKARNTFYHRVRSLIIIGELSLGSPMDVNLINQSNG